VLEPGAQTWASSLVMAPQDVGAVLARWGAVLPPEQMTVVIADEDDRDALPRAFEGLLDLPAGLLAPPAGPANRSMGLAETDAVRQVNRVAIDEGWTPREYRNLVQLGVVTALKQRPEGARIGGIPPEVFDRVADLADAQVEAIRASGAHVIGDAERLRVRDVAEPTPVPPETDQVSLDVLADVVSGLRAGSQRMRPPGRPVDVRLIRDQLGGRQLLQLLARRTAARLGVTPR